MERSPAERINQLMGVTREVPETPFSRLVTMMLEKQGMQEGLIKEFFQVLSDNKITTLDQLTSNMEKITQQFKERMGIGVKE